LKLTIISHQKKGKRKKEKGKRKKEKGKRKKEKRKMILNSSLIINDIFFRK